jgi:MFS family permease
VTRSAERRLVFVIGAVVFVDTMFYAAIAPLLPTLARELSLSKLSAGVMTAAYPVGTLAGSIPGGVLAVRAGPKRTMYLGLALLGGSTLAFGFLNDAAGLDIARFTEGLGGAYTWAGGLAWLVADAPADRRGGLIGTAIGAAIGGALFGPVIGTIASGIGRGPTFSAVVVVAIGLMAATRALPLAHSPSGQGARHLGVALRSRAVLQGVWLVALPAIVSGLIYVLGPLRMHHFGAGAAAIGAAFLTSSAIEAIISPSVGRLSDRLGRLVPMRFGLLGATVALACFTVPSTATLVAMVIVAVGTSLSFWWAPAHALLSDAAEAHGLEQGLAAAAMNLAWAGGQILGAAAGGGVAKAAGDGVPTLLAAGLCASTLLALGAFRSLARPAPRWSRRLRQPGGSRSGGG